MIIPNQKEKDKSTDGVVTMGYPIRKKLRWRPTSHLAHKFWVR